MTKFDQKGQSVNYQQNAGHITNNTYSKAPWTPPVTLPPRAQAFVGRQEDLAWLFQQLQREPIAGGRAIAICGPGGMGKTALVAEALTQLVDQKDFSTRFPDGIFYHSFYTYPTPAVAYEELALTFSEEVGADPYRAAVRALSRRQALLIFDGLEVLPDDQIPPLRSLGGTNVVLLLSRRHTDAYHVSLKRTLALLPPAEGIVLLQHIAGIYAADHLCVEQLVQHIKGFPLALQLIGSYLSSYQEHVAEYLRWFEQEGLAALDYGEHHEQSIPVLLQRTYDALAPQQQQVFALLGLLAPAPFPLELVQKILKLPERAVQETLGSLVNLSVLRRPDVGYEVSHPLVHIFATERFLSPSQRHTAALPHPISSWRKRFFANVQSRRSDKQLGNVIRTWRARLLTTLAAHFDQNDSYDRIALGLWHPHVLLLLSAEYLTAKQSLSAARLFNAVGIAALTQGKNTEAEPLFQRALAICEQQLGPMHPSTASSLNNLAKLYQAQGKYTEAEPLFLRALAIREQQLGSDHPHTAINLNNLALLYQAQGKYDEAEPLFLRALAIREQQLGSDHPHTAINLNNLALLYQAQGKYDEAEPLFLEALAISEQQLGPMHPGTASSLNNLAALYRAQGKNTEAEPLYQRALAISEQLLGPMHPDTALSLNNQAELYRVQGKYDEAKPLFQRALAITEQLLGSMHPDTASCLNNLALFYQTQGKYDEAEPLYLRALAIREQLLGSMHPDTATNLNNLALLYYAQGKYVEAEPLYQRALASNEQQLGPIHPDTARSLNNLAGLYQTQGKDSEAESLYQRALAINEQQLGPEHPTTANSLNNLAMLYREQGKYAEAEPLLQRALAISEQQLGPMHPDTARSLNNLARLYQNQKKYTEAKPLYHRAFSIFEPLLGSMHPSTQKVRKNLADLSQLMNKEPSFEEKQQVGPDHPATTTSLNNLAGRYRRQGKYADAEPLYQRVLAIFEQQVGPFHPYTAQSLNNLAELYDTQGKYTEAEPLFLRALAIREQQLGPIHPNTAASLNSLAKHYDSQGKYAEAEPLYRRALEISVASLGQKHPQTQQILQNYLTISSAIHPDADLEVLFQLPAHAQTEQNNDAVTIPPPLDHGHEERDRSI